MKEKNNFNNNLINVDILTKECKSTVLSERTILKECPICFEEPELSSLVITTCGHILCLLCAKTLINKNKQCPICSHPLGIHLRLRIFFFFFFRRDNYFFITTFYLLEAILCFFGIFFLHLFKNFTLLLYLQFFIFIILYSLFYVLFYVFIYVLF